MHHLTLARPLAAVDLETTGVDSARDRVVEFALVRYAPGERPLSVRQLVNPGVMIPSSATAVHGIGDADVAHAPPFAALAPHLAELLEGCDLAGFGLASFDLPLLSAEFARAGVRFRVAGRRVLDALAVYRRHEPRDLASAVRLYLGRDHAGAHSALADARASIEVLDRQVGLYGLPADPDALHAGLVEVDAAGRFCRGAGGAVEFAFGRHRGRRLAEVARGDPGYLRWMLDQPFLDDAHDLVRLALAGRPLPPDEM